MAKPTRKDNEAAALAAIPAKLRMDRAEVRTAIFAFRNYIALLKEKITSPTRTFESAEAAVALVDAEPLLERLEYWMRMNP
jgi:hypothetical protein